MDSSHRPANMHPLIAMAQIDAVLASNAKIPDKKPHGTLDVLLALDDCQKRRKRLRVSFGSGSVLDHKAHNIETVATLGCHRGNKRSTQRSNKITWFVMNTSILGRCQRSITLLPSFPYSNSFTASTFSSSTKLKLSRQILQVFSISRILSCWSSESVDFTRVRSSSESILFVRSGLFQLNQIERAATATSFSVRSQFSSRRRESTRSFDCCSSRLVSGNGESAKHDLNSSSTSS